MNVVLIKNVHRVLLILNLLLLTSFTADRLVTVFERVYLHLDRHYYVSGDDIWFKVYLVDAQSNRLVTSGSRTVYVELISPRSDFLSRKILRVENGMASGDFRLHDSIPEGRYRIRAYTRWMLNFGDHFVFEKEITVRTIYSKTMTGEPEGKKRRKKARTVTPEEDADVELVRPDDITLDFFPEGGSLVAGVESVVAFKATDGFGKGIDIKGTVISAEGDTVSSFRSEHLGMGMFHLTPVAGQSYYAIGKAGTHPVAVQLPEVSNRGFTMNVADQDTAFLIRISTNEETFKVFAGQKFLLQFDRAAVPVYEEMILDQTTKKLLAPKSSFPPGILRITLYDNGQRPYCERLVWIEPREKATLQFEPVAGKDTSKVKILVTDRNNRPLKASLSVAVTNGEVVPEESFDIETYLLLESEIRGRVENPRTYFDPANPDRHRQLELLLMTQGWRDFVWKHLEDSLWADSTAMKPVHPMEKEFVLSGYLRRMMVNRPRSDAFVTLYFPSLGMGEGSIRLAVTDSTGHFNLGGLLFYGSRTTILTAKSRKNKDAGLISIDSVYLPANRYPVKPWKQFQMDTTSFSVSAFKKKDYRLSDTILIDEVVVKARDKRGRLSTDQEIEPKDTIWETLEHFVASKIPRAFLPSMNKNIINRVMWHYYFPNGKRNKRYYDAAKVSMKEVSHVKIYTKVTIPSLSEVYLAPGESVINKTLFIYTVEVTSKFHTFSEYNYNSMRVVLNGYYQARKFYVPPAEKQSGGIQATLHWAPDVRTNQDGEAEVSYATPKQGPLRIQVEGLTEDGIPVVGTLRYNPQMLKK